MQNVLSKYDAKWVNRRKVCVYTDGNRIDLLMKLAEELQGTYHKRDPGSGIGCIKLEDVRVYVKPKTLPGQANELAFVQHIESFLGDGPIDIRINDRLLKGVYEVQYTAQLTRRNRKADVVLLSHDGKVPISLKQTNASRWSSADKSHGAEARELLRAALTRGDVELQSRPVQYDDDDIYRVTNQIARKLTIDEIDSVVFGSDVMNKGFVLINDFCSSNFTRTPNGLLVDGKMIRSRDEIINTEYHPYLLIRNDVGRNPKHLPRGIRAEIVYKSQITSNTVLYGSNCIPEENNGT
ncbi:hypothetical protein VPHD479_0199 [Vibrio phage D479]